MYKKAPPYLKRTVLDSTGPNKRHNNRHDIDSQLELKELGNGVVDVAAPHDGFHDGGEVVVGKNDVGGFLGHVGTGYALWVGG